MSSQPVVQVGQPTGTITTESSPTIFWFQDLDPEEPVSSRFHAKVFSDDQVTAPGFDPETTPTFIDSGVVTQAYTTVGAWDMGALGLPLPDDDYHAYVKTAVTVNGELLWSDWDSEPFTINVDQPGQPSLVVTPDSENGRVSITVDGTTGAVDTDYFQVQRSDDFETTWENLRTELGDGLIVGPDEVQFYDYEAPNGSEVTYRARARHDFAPGYSYSEWNDVIGIWSSDSFWMKHPTQPGPQLRGRQRRLRLVHLPRPLAGGADGGLPADRLERRDRRQGRAGSEDRDVLGQARRGREKGRAGHPARNRIAAPDPSAHRPPRTRPLGLDRRQRPRADHRQGMVGADG